MNFSDVSVTQRNFEDNLANMSIAYRAFVVRSIGLVAMQMPALLAFGGVRSVFAGYTTVESIRTVLDAASAN